MNQGQGTVLRSGRVIDSSSEIESPADPDMAQANSNDSDTNDNSDISSQLSEIKESYERRINELHQEFSQLKDLMMAIVSKNNNESQPSSSKGPSKPAQQQGFDNKISVGLISSVFFVKFFLKILSVFFGTNRKNSWTPEIQFSVHCKRNTRFLWFVVRKRNKGNAK